jgi:hypothetical protein
MRKGTAIWYVLTNASLALQWIFPSSSQDTSVLELLFSFQSYVQRLFNMSFIEMTLKDHYHLK